MLVEDLKKLRYDIVGLDIEPLQATIRGEAVPEDFPHHLTVQCLVAGIRHHDGFALELRGKSPHPSVERAFNARDIMSNRVPGMKQSGDMPYCFWHPDVPTPDTLRQLLREHPTPLMRYQVGRACAAGGYVDLYKELDLQPDVAIAEEARDHLSDSQVIYDMVMNAPIQYRVMDDYNLCLFENPQPGAFLNGDTCVRSTLDKRQPVSHGLFPPTFDIAEDWNLGAEGIRLEERHIPKDTVSLLYNLLPRHLPTVDKDILILMAAYTGNMDRYAPLRRPRKVNGEMQCIVRGIYHNTLFAKWCLQQPELAVLRKYVYARFIMNDDLTWVSEGESIPKDDPPTLIWYPRVAESTTYLALARLVPDMKRAAARALVVCNDWYGFERLDPEPTGDLFEEVLNGGHNEDKFTEFFKQRIPQEVMDEWEEDIQLADFYWPVVAPYDYLITTEKKPGSPAVRGELVLDDIGFGNQEYPHSDTVDGSDTADLLDPCHVRDLMRYVSAFPKTTKFYQEEEEQGKRQFLMYPPGRKVPEGSL